jgi:hypothetical protein
MRKLFLFLLLFSINGVFSQIDSTKTVKDSLKNDIYNDVSKGYSIEKPSWLKLMNTNNPDLWGGLFPALHGIENAVLITGFDKSKFKSFQDFEHIYITGNVFGKTTLYSDNHVWYGRNDRDFQKIKNGVSSRVFTFFKNKIYHNQYVLLETSKAYLFKNFTSTPETYKENLAKFDEFMKGLVLE